MTPLEEYLESAVRLEIATLVRENIWQCEEWHIMEAQRRMEHAREAGVTEAIQYPGNRNLTREALCIFVDALVVLAFQSGGVNFGRLHFEVNRRNPLDCVSYERYGVRAEKIDERH